MEVGDRENLEFGRELRKMTMIVIDDPRSNLSSPEPRGSGRSVILQIVQFCIIFFLNVLFQNLKYKKIVIVDWPVKI